MSLLRGMRASALSGRSNVEQNHRRGTPKAKRRKAYVFAHTPAAAAWCWLDGAAWLLGFLACRASRKRTWSPQWFGKISKEPVH
ncbi:unnamed protein product [Clonostachys rosea]|uniref:Uncharacterized protein n=1 Tax=Bionectria ochroleuca TaxID=29856 RepID=A0ABY6TTX5_BIOOC|nr:unnamed protein product [Clonostachys rosea]